MKRQCQHNAVAVINDRFRKSFGFNDIPGTIVLTDGISGLDETDAKAIFQAVREFDQFTQENDPYGERDFGSIEHNGHKVFWKFDYAADASCEYGSEAPEDPAQSYRILTIMLAEEY